MEVEGKEFDYVVIGGGTTGLTVAARIAENPSLSVLVLEAGSARLDDPVINVPAQLGKHFGDPRYDWGNKSVPQKDAGGRVFDWPTGKVLGGSSAINFFVWNKPPKQDVDAWEKLGNKGWNWQNFRQSLRKVENFSLPNEERAKSSRQIFNPEAHGYSGQLPTSFPSVLSGGDVGFQQTLLNTGVTVAKDPLDGDPLGTAMAVVTIDPGTYTRSYAATAYYRPHLGKENYTVLCDAFGSRIITSPTSQGNVYATSVEFVYDDRTYTVKIKKDAIVSAGAVRSPQILELSGIGDRSILEPLGIPVIVDLPGVGGNMQEHIVGNIVYELDPTLDYKTFDAFSDEAFAGTQLKLHAEGEGYHRLCVSSFTFLSFQQVVGKEAAQKFINGQRRRIEDRITNGKIPPGLKDQLLLQLEEFERGDSGDCEVIYYPQYFGGAPPGESDKIFITIQYLMNHPFSRGTTHIASRNPNDQPEIDPHYLEEPLDVDLITELINYIRNLPSIEPFKSTVVREVIPGPSCTSADDMRQFVSDNIMTAFHTVGTASMLPRDMNGVVDANLRVYGTENIRVADLSVVPLHVASHTQSIAYAIGERAADIILGRIDEV